MKPIKPILGVAMLCLAGAISLNAQQFKLTANNPSYTLDNIYDLRNTGTGVASRPCGLVRFNQLAAPAQIGTTLQHYNIANGGVVNPVFNYVSGQTNTYINLRGAKFTETTGAYLASGTVEERQVTGAMKEQIFLLKVNNSTGAVITGRCVQLPANASKPTVSNIITVGNALYVSGTVVYNTRIHVFAFRSDLNLNPLGWFRMYPLPNRHFSTFAQCLAVDGANLVLGGLDQANGRAVVFKVTQASGAISGQVTAFSLCLNPGVNCRSINRISLGFSGNYRDLVVQTTADPNNGIRFNVSSMNPAWTAPINGTTHLTLNWGIQSVRFEPTGVLLGHFDALNLRYNRSRYNPSTGAFLAGTGFRHIPPTVDATGIIRQMEMISLATSNTVFSVAKCRNTATNDTRYLMELRPAQCQTAVAPTPVNEKLFARIDTIPAIIIQVPVVTFAIKQTDLPTLATNICAPAPDGSEISERQDSAVIPENALSAFPNPFNESLTVTLAEGGIAEIMLFEMTGKMVGNWQFGSAQPTEILPVPDLTSGIYLLRVRDDNNQWHYRKLLKE